MKKGRHRRFQEARELKRQDLDSDSLSQIESLLDEEDDEGIDVADDVDVANNGRDDAGDGDDWRKEVEQYLNDSYD